MIIANEIIVKLKEEMTERMVIGMGYNTEPKILYGRYTWSEIKDIPTICFCDTGIDLNESMGDMGHAWLNILIYGYADHDGIDRADSIRDLAMDTVYFIYKDFSFTDDTEVISNIEILPGGEGKPVGIFTLEIRVMFDYTHSTINT